MTDVRKIKHKLSTRTSGGEKTTSPYRNLIKQTILTTLRHEEVDLPCEVNVLITNNKIIRRYNNDFREINKPTDVLSFPMQMFKKPGWANRDESEFDENAEFIMLGDIILSLRKARKQASDHRHTLEQETTFLIIHSTLHLLGYDHKMRAMEDMMRFKEKQIMKDMGYLEL
jgi:probable rRNA maturation factor